ncbi:MAG: hypothetical protein V1861_05115 [Candidatus Micrarchaeota archaeon]
MRFFPEDLRNEAKAIASSGKGARQVWAELKQWAGKRGPAAMKSAMMEFLSTYGGTPEAAYVMPELMRNASQVFSPSERGELVQLAMRKPVMPDFRAPQKSLSPKSMFPNPSSDRSALSLIFGPVSREGSAPRLGVIEPLSPNQDHAYMRDMPIRARERLETAMLAPQSRFQAPNTNEHGDKARQFDFDPHKSPDSRSIGAQKAENIVRSLIHSVRSHGREDHPHLSPSVPAVRKTPKKGARVSKAAKAAKKRPLRTSKPKAKAKTRKSGGKKTAAKSVKAPVRLRKRRKK